MRAGFLSDPAAERISSPHRLSQDPPDERIDLSQTKLMEIDFEYLNFSWARFDGANLTNAILLGAELNEATFHNAKAGGVLLDEHEITEYQEQELLAGGAEMRDGIPTTEEADATREDEK